MPAVAELVKIGLLDSSGKLITNDEAAISHPALVDRLIELDGQRISLLPILLQAIRRTPWLLNGDAVAKRPDSDLLTVSLPDKRRVGLPFARLKPLLATLGELFVREPGESNQRLRLSRL